MKPNYHHRGQTQIPPPTNSHNQQIMEQLIQINAQLQQKKREFEKRQEIIKLQSQFYEDSPKKAVAAPSNRVEAVRKQPQPQPQNFFDKFGQNQNQRIKKVELWKKELDQQKRQQQQIDQQKNKKRSIADDLMNELLNQRANKNITIGDVPAERQDRREKFQERMAEASKEQISKYSKQVQPTKPDQLQVQANKKRQYYMQLEKQIEFEKKRKQDQKRMKRQQEIELNSHLPPQQVQKPSKNRVSFAQPKSNQVQSNMSQREVRINAVQKQYRKGLISLQEKETTLSKINVMYPVAVESEPQLKRQSLVVKQTSTDEQVRPRTQSNARLDHSKLNPSQMKIASSQYIASPPQLGFNSPSFQGQPSLAPSQYPSGISVDMQAFQLEFMKRMFDEMKQLLKTNMVVEQQRMQETLMRNMTMVPGMPVGNMPPGNFYPVMPAMTIPPGAPMTPPYNQTNVVGFPQPTNIVPPSVVSSPAIQTNLQGGRSEMYEDSLQTDNLRIPYVSPSIKHQQYMMSESTDVQQEFFMRPARIKPFKSFKYIESPGNSMKQIPSTCVFLSNPEAKKQLKRKFDQDLVYYQKMLVQKEVQAAKANHGGYDKKEMKVVTNLKTEELLVVTPVDKYEPNLFRKNKQPAQVIRKSQQSQNNLQLQSAKKKQIVDEAASKVEKRELGQHPSVSNINDLNRMFNQCLQEQSPCDDLIDVRRQLFSGLSKINKHNEILQKYEYSQQSKIEQSQPKPITIVNQPPPLPKSSPKKTKQSKSRSKSKDKATTLIDEAENSIGLRPPPRIPLNSQVYSQTLQSMQYDSMSRNQGMEYLQISRRQLQSMKKNKDNVLIEFVTKQQSKRPSVQSEQIQEQIETRRQSRDVAEESATLMSAYEQSGGNIRTKQPVSHSPSRWQVQKPPVPRQIGKWQVANRRNSDTGRDRSYEQIVSNQKESERQPSHYSKQSSNLKLMEARRRAKQQRPRQKKESYISIQEIQKLQQDLKRKDHTQQTPPVEQGQKQKISNDRELLSKLDEMLEESEDEHYTQQFDSYRSRN